LASLASEHQVLRDNLAAKLLIGDAKNTIGQVYHSGFRGDAIFLDAFSPPKCLQLLTIEFIKKLSMCLHVDGLLGTYSCTAAVGTALFAADLQIGSTPSARRRSPSCCRSAYKRREGKGEGGK
jgi:tRNA U34 5-methylaminomethyl-2-thiouridine-forming methyltransferase MnmC